MSDSAGYWTIVIACAVSLLVAASAAASAGLLDGALDRKGATKKSPWATTNSLTGRAVISATGVVPGQSGRKVMTIANTGTRPIKRISLTQDKATRGGMSTALTLQIFDRTTKKCLYPAWKAPKRRPGRRPPPEPKKCLKMAPWMGGRTLKNVVVRPRKGATWRPKERHQIEVRWSLAKTSPTTDQGKRATFRLNWRAQA
jgi:hypothetical protein